MPKTPGRVSALLALLAGASLVGAAPAKPPTPAGSPVVVELYQSQGCSSCPPANAILNGLAERTDLLPLSFAVTYWDQLGWKDAFADPAYTARQWDYSRAGGRGNVATPQFIVNGVGVITGSDGRQLARSIRIEAAKAPGPVITRDGTRIRISPGKSSGPATVWLVRYDPKVRNVAIGRGENGGRVLPHRNIVTGLRALGTWSGEAATFPQPAYKDTDQRSAVLVQQGKGGRILAAARL